FNPIKKNTMAINNIHKIDANFHSIHCEITKGAKINLLKTKYKIKAFVNIIFSTIKKYPDYVKKHHPYPLQLIPCNGRIQLPCKHKFLSLRHEIFLLFPHPLSHH